jgi:hypothetical protein
LTDDDQRSVVFAHPGCRDYLLGRLDDADLAEEWAGRLRRLPQLLSLTRSAGLLSAEPGIVPAPDRPALAKALLARRTDLAAVIMECCTFDAPVGTLRDAAALLSVYGTPETSGLLLNRIEALIATDQPTPVPAGLLLASWLHRLPVGADLVARLITSVLANAHTSRDLDAYETLPAELRPPLIHDLACRRAAAIIDAELAVLATEPDPGVIRETALDLAERARWYGYDVHINALLDHADEAGS